MKATLAWFSLFCVLMAAIPALAQNEFEEDALTEGDSASSGDADEAFLTDTEEAEIEAPAVEKDVGLAEDPQKPYFSVGLRLRWIMIPEWFIKMFGVDTTRPSGTGSALPLISNIGVGPEFTYRKDGFDITAAIWYAGLGWNDSISFKGSGEDGNSWEVIENDLHAILITVDFMWSTSIKDWFAIIYGAGLGLGIPWGDIIRTEATEESNGTEKCLNENDPDPWCNPDEQYGVTYDKLKVIPWINFLAGARFKPHRHFVIYVDGGFGMGFQIGTRAGYIF
jgi:hypothetical protein